MSGIVGSRFNHRGSGLVASLGTDGQVFTSAGAGKSAVYEDAAGGGAWTFLNKTTISDDSEIDIESGLDSTYPLYAFVFNKIVIATDAQYFKVRFKVSTYQTGNDYRYHSSCTKDASDPVDFNDAYSDGLDHFKIISAAYLGNASTESLSGILYLPHPSDTNLYKITWHTCVYMKSDGSVMRTQGHGGYDGGAEAITGVRFLMSSGNLTSGTISLYGIADS